MYCTHCGYHSFDHLDSCPKCGQSWEAPRKKLGLQWIEETKGDWLGSANGMSGPPPPEARSHPPSLENNPEGSAEEEFVLEEDREDVFQDTASKKPGETETFLFEEEMFQEPPSMTVSPPGQELPPPGREDGSSPPSPSEGTEISDDLLVPGLEEMLRAPEQSRPAQTGSATTTTARPPEEEPISVSLEEEPELPMSSKGPKTHDSTPLQQAPAHAAPEEGDDQIAVDLSELTIEPPTDGAGPNDDRQPPAAHCASGTVEIEMDDLDISVDEAGEESGKPS
ncbi:hypothetical protein [Desulfoplanes sp.]